MLKRIFAALLLVPLWALASYSQDMDSTQLAGNWHQLLTPESNFIVLKFSKPDAGGNGVYEVSDHGSTLVQGSYKLGRPELLGDLATIVFFPGGGDPATQHLRLLSDADMNLMSFNERTRASLTVHYQRVAR